LTNFYQTHRRLQYSRIANQFLGLYVDFPDLSPAAPYRSEDDDPDPSKWILPSGLFAVSVFNDTFLWNNTNQIFDESAIVSAYETGYLYQQLNAKYTTGHKWLEESELFPENGSDPHFIAWMRSSAMPSFEKEYGICDDCHIPAGVYPIEIHARFPSEWFKGEKWLVVVEVPGLGDRSLYLGVAFLVVWFVLLVFGIGLIAQRFLRARR
jgi:hypothetical protein